MIIESMTESWSEPIIQTSWNPWFEGPFLVTQVHVNGTLTIQRAPNVMEQISVCWLKPYREPQP